LPLFFHRVIIFLSNPFSLSALRRKRKENQITTSLERFNRRRIYPTVSHPFRFRLAFVFLLDFANCHQSRGSLSPYSRHVVKQKTTITTTTTTTTTTTVECVTHTHARSLTSTRINLLISFLLLYVLIFFILLSFVPPLFFLSLYIIFPREFLLSFRISIQNSFFLRVIFSLDNKKCRRSIPQKNEGQ
jgi:hypothetical protein